jgi:tetratricopeptide (TPR) repeat protein
MKRLNYSKKYAIALLLFICLTGYSSDIRLDLGPEDAEYGNGTLSAAEKRKADALASFAAALTSKKPEETIARLIETLKNDPDAELPMRLLLNQISNSGEAEKISRALAETAEANPRALKLTLAAILMLKDQNRKRGIEIAENCLKNSPDWKKLNPVDMKVFCSIISVLGSMYSTDKTDFSKGDALFEDYLDNNTIGHNYNALESAALFYHQAGEKVDNNPFLWVFESDKDKYLRKKQEYLTKIKDYFPNTEDKNILSAMVALYESLGLEKEAEETLLRRILADPNDIRLLVKLAGLYFKQKDFTKSVAVWRSVIKSPAITPEFYMGYGDAAFYAGYYTEAGNAYEAYLKENHGSGVAAFMLAMVCFEQGDFKKTLSLLRSMPDNFMVLKIRAMAEDRLGNEREALNLLLQAENAALQTNHDFLDSIFYLFMVVMAEKNNKPELVIKYAALIEKKFSLKDPMLANAVGYTYADMNIKLDEAEKLIRYAMEKDPDKPEYYDSLAWVLYRNGKFNEALVYIKTSIEKQGKLPNAIIADHAGDIYFALGKTDDAVKYWKTALHIYSRETSPPKIEEKLKKAAERINAATKK